MADKRLTFHKKNDLDMLHAELRAADDRLRPVADALGELNAVYMLEVGSKDPSWFYITADEALSEVVARVVAAHNPAPAEARKAAAIQFHKEVMAYLQPLVGKKADGLILLDQHRYRVAQLYIQGALNTDWTIKPLSEWLGTNGNGAGNGHTNGTGGRK